MSDEQTTTPVQADNVDQATTAAESTATQEIDFKSLLAEDMRSNPSIKDFKDLNSLAKSYIEQKSLLGNAVRIPSEHATDEDRASFRERLLKVDGVVALPKEGDAEALKAFRAKIGVPESADKYKYSIEESEDIDTEAVQKFSQMVHELGLTNSQADQLLHREIELMRTSAKEAQERSDAFSAKIKAEWGEAYDSKVAAAQVGLASLEKRFPSEIKDLETAGVLNNPAMLTALAEIGGQMQEASAAGLRAKPSARTPAEAKALISEIMSNPAHPLMNSDHPGHRQALVEWEKLHNEASAG